MPGGVRGEKLEVVGGMSESGVDRSGMSWGSRQRASSLRFAVAMEHR